MTFAIAIAGFWSHMLHVRFREVVTMSEIVKPSEFNFRLAEFYTAGKT